MNTTPALPRTFWLACAIASCVATAGGCSSVIGSAYLRDAWLDAVEHAAEKAAEEKQEAAARGPAGSERKKAAVAEASAADRGVDPPEDEAASTADIPMRRYAAIEDAVTDADRMLEGAGGLSVAARETLVAMLEGMPKQDWPIAVDEFTAALAAVESPRVQSGKAAPPVVDVPVPPLPPAQPPAAATPEPVAIVPDSAVVVPKQPVPPPAPVLAVQNACFATRVRAWGAVDRFDASQFTPGQEVIVYFELEHLASKESPDGHTTRVDTTLKLVGADGRRLHEWKFEPLEEICRSQRRDYFARYVLAFPESTPAGPCRLELSVTDAVAGCTAQATLPLEMQGR